MKLIFLFIATVWSAVAFSETVPRQFDSDRPGITDSPHTVDPQHFQIESGLVGLRLAVDPTNPDARQSTMSYLNTSIGYGLSPNVEVQLTWDGYLDVNSNYNNQSTTAQGAGNTGARVKWNLMGNDGGQFAIALIGFVREPSGAAAVSASKVEDGLNVPMQIQLNPGNSLNFMTTLWSITNANGQGLHDAVLTALSLFHDLSEKSGAYVQIYNISSDELGATPAASAGIGYTYKPMERLQFDIGADSGLTKAADHLNSSLGVAWRY